MLKLSWTEKVKNEEVLQRMNEKRKLTNILKERKLNYFGHLIWLNNIHRTPLEGYIDGKRGKGGPRMSWYDNSKEWTGMRYEWATRIPMDRDKWRASVSSNIERYRKRRRRIILSATVLTVWPLKSVFQPPFGKCY